MEEWTSDSNESLVISMGMSEIEVACKFNSLKAVRSPVDKDVLTETEDYDEFNPTFTYPVRRSVASLAHGE